MSKKAIGLDFTDPLVRLLCAPSLADARRHGARLTPEMDAVANEDGNREIFELRLDQFSERLAKAKNS
ncbi:MAG: hypothetical protein ACREH5_08175 [Candidatus Omnitrophota bacterium]